MATAAQRSANSTAWSLKKLPTISVPTPSQGQRRRVPGAGRFLSHGGLGGVGVGELQVRRHLLEIADELVRDGAFQHRQQCPEGLDSELSLIEVAILLREFPVGKRGDRVEGLDEQVRDLELLQLLLE